MWKAGKLPVPAEQLPTGTVILRPPQDDDASGVTLYARVSSAEKNSDLDRQLARLAEFSAQRGFRVLEVVKETGSGWNGQRRALLRILRNPRIQTVIVEHRDRLMRLGFEYVEAALAASGRRILVVEEGEIKDDMVRDLQEVMVSLCSRLYGKRVAKNRARKAVEALG